MEENTLTIVGNLTADPVLRFTGTGTAVTTFRLAQTPRYLEKSSGVWRDADSLFLSVTCWRGLAENVAASMRKGDRVLVKGRLRQREFETTPGDRKSVIELEADMVGPELARAIATPRKVSRDVAFVAPTTERMETLDVAEAPDADVVAESHPLPEGFEEDVPFGTSHQDVDLNTEDGGDTVAA